LNFKDFNVTLYIITPIGVDESDPKEKYSPAVRFHANPLDWIEKSRSIDLLFLGLVEQKCTY
jgi:hypothetical protein